jgi:hypothetical protein
MYQLNDCGYRKSRLLYQDTEKLVFPANMILAVLLAIIAAQKHVERRLPELRGRREDAWSRLYRFAQGSRRKHTA